MTVVRISRFALAEGTTEDALRRERSRLIGHVGRQVTGLMATELVRLHDGGWQDTWTWSSSSELRRATEAAPSFPPGVRTVFAHISDVEVIEGDVVEGDATSGGIARPGPSGAAG